MESEAGRRTALGAYGLRLRGVAARDLLVAAEPTWPEVELHVRTADVPHSATEHVTSNGARLNLRTGGYVQLERDSGRATFVVPRPLSDEELVHPYLAPVAAVMSYWLERESFHAGAVAAGGNVWGIVGDRFAGKSSTLARLAQQGQEVLADDLLVLEPDTARVFAGPRSIDLREDAAALLGAGREIGVAGARERWRLRLEPTARDARLKGWVFLTWGPTIELRDVRGSARVATLAAQRGVRLPPSDPTILLDLASLPCWELSRPQRWDALERSAELLLDTLAG